MSRTWIVLLIIVASPAAAQELTPEEQAEIEKAVAADSARPTPPPAPAPTGVAAGLQSLNPDISFIADVALAWFSDDETLPSSHHDPAETGFTLQQLEMAVGKSVDPYFRLDGNLIFTPEEGVEIEEIYATTLALPASLQLRAGQFLSRFGRVNAQHLHQWEFVDQAFPVGRVFGEEGSRGVGAELSWLTPLPWFVELTGSVTGVAGDFQGVVTMDQFFPLGDDLSLLLGLSAATFPIAAGDDRSDVLGADLYLKFRPVTRQSSTIVSLQAEVFHRRRRVAGARVTDTSAYAQLLWRFAQRWTTAGRWEWGSPSDVDEEWTDDRHRLTASLTFYPTEFSRLRVQGSVDLPGWREDPLWAVMTALEFTIGAHGAHKF
jgi:hypothetical protein